MEGANKKTLRIACIVDFIRKPHNTYPNNSITAFVARFKLLFKSAAVCETFSNFSSVDSLVTFAFTLALIHDYHTMYPSQYLIK